jgi:hypothetical protein
MLLQVFYTGKARLTFYAVSPKNQDYQDGSLEMPQKAGFTQNTHCYQVPQIPVSVENAEVQKDELKRLRD